jgi:Family of unknown function (DUF5565)
LFEAQEVFVQFESVPQKMKFNINNYRMKKMSTLFAKDSNNLARVINKINIENAWVINGEAIATRKFDGTAVTIINNELFKRFDAKKGRQIPENAIPCQEPDLITGHHPHWVKCNRLKTEDKFFFEGFDNLDLKVDGTYELCGPKVQANPENLEMHKLIKHGAEVFNLSSFAFDDLKDFLMNNENDIEGIVFHHKSDERMCKLRKSDFGIKRLQLEEA